MTTIYHTRTIEELARHIEARQTAAGNHALVSSYSTQGTLTPIFCHGGSLELARQLSVDRPLYWLFPHGTDGGALPATIEAMAQDYLPEIRRIQPHGPYNFLGYSVGGLVLFDLAHRLMELGEPVAMLAMVDTGLPQVGDGAPSGSDDTGFRALLAKVCANPFILPKLINKIQLSRRVQRRLRSMARSAKLTGCNALLRNGYRLPPSARNFYFDETIEPIVGRYVLPPYRGPLLVFRRPDNGSDLQWRGLASGPVQIHDAWVDHNQFLEKPFVTILAQEVSDCMRAATQSRLDWPGQYPRPLAGRLSTAPQWGV